ncbi:MAG: magnesium chelatase [Chloroflexi bacterium RBG_16_50_9]|nr:MAG: magnesium chelatase [Chloroflexi bacterium RBG_16_50_9]
MNANGPSEQNRPKTIGELRRSGYTSLPIREEMRHNLIALIKAKKPIFNGIIGYDSTVIPQVENAVLSGQNIIFLGERGQAKSRVMRLLVGLLDEAVPVIRGCEINDNPFSPICKSCREKVAREGDATEIAWLSRKDRYGEKLATPDTTIADLIGDVDPIKVAEGRYLSDELTMHYGIIPRTNRGIFCINELPDLAERLQVGLFNLLEEADIQIKGYRVRLPLDILLVASANPEDYTSRGRIITPLKDRFGAQIRTHYPVTIKDEIAIVEQEWQRFNDGDVSFYVPDYVKEIIAEITHLARKSPDISQRSGVSVRVSIANMETVVANAIRRATVLGEKLAVPRISDFPYIVASTTGKVEIEGFEEKNEQKIIDDLTKKAVLAVFNRYFQFDELEPIVKQFNGGFNVETSDNMSAKSYVRYVKEIPGMAKAAKKITDTETPETLASVVEFILEGTHLNKRLNKTKVEGKTVYKR